MTEETRSVGKMPTYKQSPGIFVIAVVALSLISIILVVGMLYCAIIDKQPPANTDIVLGVALGALAGMITPRGEEG